MNGLRQCNCAKKTRKNVGYLGIMSVSNSQCAIRNAQLGHPQIMSRPGGAYRYSLLRIHSLNSQCAMRNSQCAIRAFSNNRHAPEGRIVIRYSLLRIHSLDWQCAMRNAQLFEYSHGYG